MADNYTFRYSPSYDIENNKYQVNYTNANGVAISPRTIGFGEALGSAVPMPLIAKRVFNTYNEALTFAKTDIGACEGLVITVINDTNNRDKEGIYLVKKVGSSAELEKAGTGNNTPSIISSSYSAQTFNDSFTLVTAVTSGMTYEEAINQVEHSVNRLVDEVISNEEVVTTTINNLAGACGLYKPVKNPNKGEEGTYEIRFDAPSQFENANNIMEVIYGLCEVYEALASPSGTPLTYAGSNTISISDVGSISLKYTPQISESNVILGTNENGLYADLTWGKFGNYNFDDENQGNE